MTVIINGVETVTREEDEEKERSTEESRKKSIIE